MERRGNSLLLQKIVGNGADCVKKTWSSTKFYPKLPILWLQLINEFKLSGVTEGLMTKRALEKSARLVGRIWLVGAETIRFPSSRMGSIDASLANAVRSDPEYPAVCFTIVAKSF